MHQMHRMHLMYPIWLQWHEWRGCFTGRFANCLSWQQFPLDLIPHSPRDLRWKCHRLRCSQCHVGSPGIVVRPIGPSTAAPAGSKKIVEGWQGWCQKELSSHSSSASSRHHVSFNFWPHLLFNSMHASMDYFSSLAAFLASCRFLRCTFWYLLCLLALIDSG